MVSAYIYCNLILSDYSCRRLGLFLCGPEGHWSWSYGIPWTCSCLYPHTISLFYTHTHSPLFPPVNPHYPPVLTEKFSSPGHRKGSPAASRTLTCSNTHLPSTLVSTAISLPVLPPPHHISAPSETLCHPMNFELFFCMFRSPVVLCEVSSRCHLMITAVRKRSHLTIITAVSCMFTYILLVIISFIN